MSAARDILVTSPPVSGWLETREVTIARLSIGGSLLRRDGPIRGLVTFGQTFVLRSHSRIAPGPRVVASVDRGAGSRARRAK